MNVKRLLIVLTLALALWPLWSHSEPTPTPSSSRLPPGVTPSLKKVYVNKQFVGVTALVMKDNHPLCPVRLGVVMKFKVDYVESAHMATLTKPTGETAVFKVGMTTALVKTKAGLQSKVNMPLAPMILAVNLPRVNDRMWIPLETVVELAGGKMEIVGRDLRLTL